MNLASWVILGIVLLAAGLAIRSTFFKKGKGGCCSVGDSQGGCSASGCAGCSCTSCSAVRLPELPDTK